MRRFQGQVIMIPHDDERIHDSQDHATPLSPSSFLLENLLDSGRAHFFDPSWSFVAMRSKESGLPKLRYDLGEFFSFNPLAPAASLAKPPMNEFFSSNRAQLSWNE
jgi:hypothetical protein